jgi:hypothetical protein
MRATYLGLHDRPRLSNETERYPGGYGKEIGSKSNFLASREINRDFRDFGLPAAGLKGENRCTATTFRAIPYSN